MINRDGLENSDHWVTPDWLYKKLDNEFHLTLILVHYMRILMDYQSNGEILAL